MRGLVGLRRPAAFAIEAFLLPRRAPEAEGSLRLQWLGHRLDVARRAGERVSWVIPPEGGSEPVAFSVPTHVAERNGIAPGAQARVTLLAESIHLMPWEPLAEARAE